MATTWEIVDSSSAHLKALHGILITRIGGIRRINDNICADSYELEDSKGVRIRFSDSRLNGPVYMWKVAGAPPAPDPDGPCVLKGEVCKVVYGISLRSRVDMQFARKCEAAKIRHKLLGATDFMSHLEIVPAALPKTEMVTKWRVTSRYGKSTYTYYRDAVRAMLHASVPFHLDEVEVPADE